jgi:cell division protein FtsQ
VSRQPLHHPALGAAPTDRRRGLRRAVSTGIAGGVVATVIGLVAHELAEGEAWEVSSVQVVGNVRVSDEAVRHLADIRTGEHLFAVDLEGALHRVAAHPWVARAEARRLVPGTVELVIEEHEPVLLLALDELWYLDRAGRPFALARTDDLDYPLLTGLDPRLVDARPDLAAAVVQGALHLLAAVDGNPRAGVDQLSELRFDGELGFTLVLRNGTELVMGFGDPQTPLHRLDQLIRAGLDIGRPHRVDLDADRVAVVTPLGAPGSSPSDSQGAPRVQ